MNIDRFNQWLSVIANLGVIVGIIFLAYEIQQNTAAIRSDTRNALTSEQIEFAMNLGTDADSSAILIQGNSVATAEELSELPPEIRTRYYFFVQSNFRIWENEYYQYKIGLFDSGEFEPRLRNWRRFFVLFPGYIAVWKTVGWHFSPEFQELIDQMVSEVESGGA